MGRVSVKINTTKKLSDLNEYGVYHLSSLLLCCAAQFSEDHNPHHIAKLLLQVSQEGLEILFQCLESLRENHMGDLMVMFECVRCIKSTVNSQHGVQHIVGLRRHYSGRFAMGKVSSCVRSQAKGQRSEGVGLLVDS